VGERTGKNTHVCVVFFTGVLGLMSTKLLADIQQVVGFIIFY